jgi:hypothetical protein
MEAQHYDEEQATEEVQLVEEVLRLAYAEFRHWLPTSWQDGYYRLQGRRYNAYVISGLSYWSREMGVFPIGAQMYADHTAASLRLVQEDGSIALAALRRYMVRWLDKANEGTTVRDLYQEELERSGMILPDWLLDEDPDGCWTRYG